MLNKSAICVKLALLSLFVTFEHGTEALIYSDYPREAAASMCLAMNF